MNKDPIELTKAKAGLLLEQPFFASLALKMEYIPDHSIKTANTNGKHIKYNPDYFQSLSHDQRLGLIAHEVMHPAMLHHTRRNGRDSKKWNKACDYAINHLIKESGIILPDRALLDDRYKNMSAEQIYSLLPDEDGNGKDWQPGQGFEGGMGDVEDWPDPNTEQLETQQQKMNMIEANIMAERMGKDSAGLKRIVDELLHPYEYWTTVLERLLSIKAKDDYSWRKPNRSYINRGIYVPALYSEKYGEVVMAIDTSGSQTRKNLAKIESDINEIHGIVDNTVYVMYADSKMNGMDVFEQGDNIKLNMYGGGGTSFIPPFKHVEEHGLQPKLLLYFTDGLCNKFPPEPEYDVIWCINNTRPFNPPFGEVVRVLINN